MILEIAFGTNYVSYDEFESMFMHVIRIMTEIGTLMDGEWQIKMCTTYKAIKHPYDGAIIPVLLSWLTTNVFREGSRR